MENVKENITKAVRVDLPIELHTKCNLIKAHKYITDQESAPLSEIILELIQEALSLPKYNKVVNR